MGLLLGPTSWVGKVRCGEGLGSGPSAPGPGSLHQQTVPAFSCTPYTPAPTTSLLNAQDPAFNQGSVPAPTPSWRDMLTSKKL